MTAENHCAVEYPIRQVDDSVTCYAVTANWLSIELCIELVTLSRLSSSVRYIVPAEMILDLVCYQDFFR